MAVGPEEIDRLLDEADDALDRGELDVAEQRYREAIAADASCSPAWSALAGVLFDQLRFDEARAAVRTAVRTDETNAEAYWVRGLLRERRGDLRGADRDFLRASRLDGEAFPRPETLSDAMISAVVEEAKGSVHPSIRAWLDQVAFVVDEVPPEDVCLDFDPPALPGELLGCFTGPAVPDRSGDDPWSHLPSTIVLYRRNLERLAWDRDHLVEELRITVLHEVGHFLGLDEDDLEQRGLE